MRFRKRRTYKQKSFQLCMLFESEKNKLQICPDNELRSSDKREACLNRSKYLYKNMRLSCVKPWRLKFLCIFIFYVSFFEKNWQLDNTIIYNLDLLFDCRLTSWWTLILSIFLQSRRLLFLWFIIYDVVICNIHL